MERLGRQNGNTSQPSCGERIAPKERHAVKLQYLWLLILSLTFRCLSLSQITGGLATTADVAERRARLTQYIWGDLGWPSQRTPAVVDTQFYDGLYAHLYGPAGNLGKIDRYVVILPNGFTSTAYHFRPLQGNGRLFIYHAGHAIGGFRGEDIQVNGVGDSSGGVIPSLLAHGFAVLGFSMPTCGNPWGYADLPGIGPTYIRDHNEIFQYLANPYRYFVEPLVIVLNYVEDAFGYSEVSMTGLSGGGWTTTLYSAIDPRITRSYPVAGSSPFDSYLMDSEQSDPGLRSIANYAELYVLGSAGPGRHQTQILNRFDDCCFAGERHIEWVPEVKSVVEGLGAGSYDFYLDETIHTHRVSEHALALMLSEPGSPVLDPPELLTEDPGVPLFPQGIPLDWTSPVLSDSCRLQVSLDSTFQSAPLIDFVLPSYLSKTAITLTSRGARVHWRVRGQNHMGEGPWSSTGTFTTEANRSPRFTSIPPDAALEDSTYQYQPEAVDSDTPLLGDVVRYRLLNNEFWLKIDTATGLVYGVPRGSDVGVTTVYLEALDAEGGNDVQRLDIQTQHTNHSPAIVSVPHSEASEDSLYKYHVAAVDSDSDLFGDTLRYHLIAGPEWLSMDSSNGLLSGTPAAGDVGVWNVKILIDDGKGGSVTQDFALSVFHVNHSPRFPSANLKDLVAVEDSVFSVTFGALDTDVPNFGDTLRYRAIVLPRWLSLDPFTGQVTGSPREGDRDTILSIIVTDGYFSDTLDVTLRVTPVNDPPALSTMPSWEVDEFDSLTVSFASLYPYVHDPDDPDSLMHWTVSGTRDLYVCTTPEGIRVIPQNGWAGIDSVRLIVRDSGGLADSSDVRVAVSPVDHPPTITSAPDTIAYADLPYRWEIKVHDIHPTDTTFSYYLVGPSWLSIGPGGFLEGRPRTTGRATVTVRVSDRAGFSDSVRFHITVKSNDELKDLAGAVPTTFVLKPNYPNPFNPVTTIRFGVPEKSRVTLRVFNVIGQLVEQLADDERDAGYYEVRWAPRTLASGVYFLLMEAQSSTSVGYSYRSTHRMLLLK